jgi:hypothetical protein
MMTAKTHVEVGDPIDFSEYYDREGDRAVLAHITKRLLAEIARLGGHPDFVPEMAGRAWKHEELVAQ